MRALAAALAIQRATSTAAAFTDIERFLVAERRRLEVAIVVQTLASVAGAVSIGNVIALGLPDLRHACGSR